VAGRWPGGRRRPGVADLLVGLGLVRWFGSGYVFSAIVGFLLNHPLAHLLLTGSISAQVTGGAYAREGKMPLAEVVVAAIIGSAMFDPLFYWIGRRYGDVLTRVLVRTKMIKPRSVERGERMIARYGGWAVLCSWYLPVPNILIFAAVGSAGMSLPLFLLLDVLAALLWSALVVGLGYAIGHPAVALAIDITHYAWWIFGVSTALSVGFVCWRHRETLRAVAARRRGRTPS
jgi:membrane-associated protein